MQSVFSQIVTMGNEQRIYRRLESLEHDRDRER